MKPLRESQWLTRHCGACHQHYEVLRAAIIGEDISVVPICHLCLAAAERARELSRIAYEDTETIIFPCHKRWMAWPCADCGHVAHFRILQAVNPTFRPQCHVCQQKIAEAKGEIKRGEYTNMKPFISIGVVTVMTMQSSFGSEDLTRRIRQQADSKAVIWIAPGIYYMDGQVLEGVGTLDDPIRPAGAHVDVVMVDEEITQEFKDEHIPKLNISEPEEHKIKFREFL